jgi:hypothetical protein
MRRQASGNPSLDDLKDLETSKLAAGVEKTEGVNGSTIEPVYSKRKMQTYTITRSELKQIGLANLAITGTTSIGSALFVFGIDILKDTTLSESVPREAELLVSYVQPICIGLGIGFWVFSGFLMWWRRGMIELIKNESA